MIDSASLFLDCLAKNGGVVGVVRKKTLFLFSDVAAFLMGS